MTESTEKMPQTPALGVRLRKAREDQGWTVREVGRRARVAPSYLTRIEKGERNPKLPTIERLELALGLVPQLQPSKKWEVLRRMLGPGIVNALYSIARQGASLEDLQRLLEEIAALPAILPRLVVSAREYAELARRIRSGSF